MRVPSFTATLFAVIGFISGCFLFFYSCGESHSNFHEIKTNPTAIARTVLTDQRDKLMVRMGAATALIDSLSKIKLPDGQENESLVAAIKARHDDSAIYFGIIPCFSLRPDTATMNRTQAFLTSNASLDLLDGFDSAYMEKPFSSMDMIFTYDDTTLQNEEVTDTLTLPLVPFRDDIDVFTQYPGFGIWALMIVVFCSALFMLTAFCIATGKELDEFTEGTTCAAGLGYWKSWLFCLVAMILFTIAIDRTFYDDFVVKDFYFMKGFSTRLKVLILFGYLGAVFCFAGMISAGSYARCYIGPILSGAGRSERKLLVEEIAGLKAALTALEPDSPARAGIATQMDTKKTALATLDAQLNVPVQAFIKLRELFRRFFYAISILLALLVFCTGTLYSAIDSLDFIKMIKDDMGFSPVRHDFIYLYGGLHTVLILFFYLPAQFQFRIDKDLLLAAEEEAEKPTWLSGLKGQLSKIQELLVVSAPLVASLVQWLMDLVFGP